MKKAKEQKVFQKRNIQTGRDQRRKKRRPDMGKRGGWKDTQTSEKGENQAMRLYLRKGGSGIKKGKGGGVDQRERRDGWNRQIPKMEREIIGKKVFQIKRGK